MSIKDLEVPNAYVLYGESMVSLGRQIQSLSASAVNVSGALSVPAILGGIVTSSTAASVVMTIPASSAVALLAGFASKLAGASLDLLVVNSGGANAITMASSDSNIVFADPSLSIPAHSSRLLKVVVNVPATPSFIIY